MIFLFFITLSDVFSFRIIQPDPSTKYKYQILIISNLVYDVARVQNE